MIRKIVGTSRTLGLSALITSVTASILCQNSIVRALSHVLIISNALLDTYLFVSMHRTTEDFRNV